MSIMPAAVQLLHRLQSVEAAAAAALGVPAPAVDDSVGGSEPPSCDVEKGGKCAAGGGGGGSSRATMAAPSAAQRMRPYVANAAALLTLLSSAAAWMAIAKGVATGCRGLRAALSSRATLRSGQQTLPHLARLPCTAGLCGWPPTHRPCCAAAVRACSPAQAGAPVCDQVVAGQQPGHGGQPALHLEGKCRPGCL